MNQLLIPFSWLYGLVAGLRNKLFDWKILPSESFDLPVISIGNLSVGGTGKTPHTEYLIRLLSKKYRVAVLSRGYKRKTKGFVLADENANAQTIGDEPFQMYRKFPGIILAVDANRRRGIHTLLEKQPDVILLDDAFQHRYVKPSFSILLTDCKRPFWNDQLLPAGRLREPISGAKRADMIIITKNNNPTLQTPNSTLYTLHSTLYTLNSKFTYKGLLPVFPESSAIKKENLEHLKKEQYSILLVAGLANPQNLIDYLKNYTTDLQTLCYPDHHSFNQKNIIHISDNFYNIPNINKLIITSEKDAVRLMNNSYLSDEIKPHIYYIPIETVFCGDDEHLFISKIENHVKEFTRNRILA